MTRTYIKKGFTERYRTSVVRQSGVDIVKWQNRVKQQLKKRAKNRKQEALDKCYLKGIREGKEAADKKAAAAAISATNASSLPSSPPTAVVTIYDTPTKRQKLIEDAGISQEKASTLTSPQVTQILFFIDLYNNSLI